MGAPTHTALGSRAHTHTMGGGLLVLHAAAAALMGQMSTFMQERSYVELFEAPRITTTLRNFLGEPGVLLELTRPAFAMNIIGEDPTDTGSMRQWLFAQTISVSNRGSSPITMLYAGMEDGRFIGCACWRSRCIAMLENLPR